MCLILFSYKTHPAYPLILAANRDEFYDRPTGPMGFWPDSPHILGGRDFKRRGTWLGVTRRGRWAAITNYRQPALQKTDAPSRGHLVSHFLEGAESACAYLERIQKKASLYEGFNLILGDHEGLCYYSNMGGEIRKLPPGLYGLSNHLLNTPWPKVKKGRAGLQTLLAGQDRVNSESLFQLLADPSRPQEQELPQTGVSPAWERTLGPIFIASPDYGTRSSSVVLMEKSGRITVAERTYVPDSGRPAEPRTRQFSFMKSG